MTHSGESVEFTINVFHDTLLASGVHFHPSLACLL